MMWCDRRCAIYTCGQRFSLESLLQCVSLRICPLSEPDGCFFYATIKIEECQMSIALSLQWNCSAELYKMRVTDTRLTAPRQAYG